MKIVTAGVKGGIEFTSGEVIKGVNPAVFVRQSIVDDSRIPVIAMCKDDMW